MRNRFNQFAWLAILSMVVLLIVLPGCKSDDSLTNPIADTTGNAADRANFETTNRWTSGIETVAGDDYGWVGDVKWTGWHGPDEPPFIIGDDDTQFWVTVMKGGDYVLEYETWLGAFYIMFRAESQVSMQISLTGRDTLQGLYIHEGSITGSQSVVYEDNGIQVFGELPYANIGGVPAGFQLSQSTTLIDPVYGVNFFAVAVCQHWIDGGVRQCWWNPTTQKEECWGDWQGVIRNGCWPFGPDVTYGTIYDPDAPVK